MQLNSHLEAAGETSADEANYVRELLLPFLEKERFFAEMLEES